MSSYKAIQDAERDDYENRHHEALSKLRHINGFEGCRKCGVKKYCMRFTADEQLCGPCDLKRHPGRYMHACIVCDAVTSEEWGVCMSCWVGYSAWISQFMIPTRCAIIQAHGGYGKEAGRLLVTITLMTGDVTGAAISLKPKYSTPSYAGADRPWPGFLCPNNSHIKLDARALGERADFSDVLASEETAEWVAAIKRELAKVSVVGIHYIPEHI